MCSWYSFSKYIRETCQSRYPHMILGLSKAKERSFVRQSCASMMREESNHNKQTPFMI